MRYLASLILTLFTLMVPTYSAPPQVEIYTIPGCFGCNSAKSMLEERGISYTEISLKGRPDLYRQMKERVYSQVPPNQRGNMDDSMTVPRIFINGKYIGGYSDLSGAELDKLSNNNKSVASRNPEQAAKQTNKNEES